MRTQSAREIVKRLPIAPRATGAVPKSPSLEKDDPWVPWFPVIDYDRCINCKQCMNFCLFGTFSLSEDGTVVVSSPSSCKTNCPACGRICPQVAIMFPKYP
ncbi:MAG: 4Fe-4S binding protein, partial [Planctomycetes bacterium]|nr:4Fe-4S binding protein [Planctomycetota bacterium]